ncbi:MAG: hypothetical protein JO160_08720 [Candidatus Eremiobacteraeota bacterium]|nr:hypothetical protein [Candidatus Eremiobacteraeota bacterium]
MDVRLVQLLGSFIRARGDYALARLECAIVDDATAPPPIIDRLADASELTLRVQWPLVERQLDEAIQYGKSLSRAKNLKYQREPGYRALERSLRELDQYARAIRWVLTVTESEDPT